MTLAAQMVSDVTGVFLNLTEHAEAFGHQPLGSTTPTTYTGIIERGEDIDPGAFADGLVRKIEATIETAINGVAITGGPATVARGDKVVFDGKDWFVAGRPKQDGAGMQLITVRREEVETFAAEQNSIRKRG